MAHVTAPRPQRLVPLCRPLLCPHLENGNEHQGSGRREGDSPVTASLRSAPPLVGGQVCLEAVCGDAGPSPEETKDKGQRDEGQTLTHPESGPRGYSAQTFPAGDAGQAGREATRHRPGASQFQEEAPEAKAGAQAGNRDAQGRPRPSMAQH